MAIWYWINILLIDEMGLLNVENMYSNILLDILPKIIYKISA